MGGGGDRYITGEYIHLLVMVVCPFDAHIVAILLFAGVAATLPALNHTRFDLAIMLPSGHTLWSVKNHDQHHVYPNCNYGNYTMLWDHLCGTFIPHPYDDDNKNQAVTKKQPAQQQQTEKKKGNNETMAVKAKAQ